MTNALFLALGHAQLWGKPYIKQQIIYIKCQHACPQNRLWNSRNILRGSYWVPFPAQQKKKINEKEQPFGKTWGGPSPKWGVLYFFLCTVGFKYNLFYLSLCLFVDTAVPVTTPGALLSIRKIETLHRHLIVKLPPSVNYYIKFWLHRESDILAEAQVITSNRLELESVSLLSDGNQPQICFLHLEAHQINIFPMRLN